MIVKVKEALDRVDHVSTTADVWTAHYRSYLGMTAHWIDHRSFKCQIAAIACVCMIGRHTYHVLAESIEEIHRKYRLSGKVTTTVTDNRSKPLPHLQANHLEDQMKQALMTMKKMMM